MSSVLPPGVPPPPGMPPRPDFGTGGPPGPGERGAEGIPPATWQPIEALPVFLIAIGVSALIGVTLVSLGCAAQIVVTSLVGELAFGIVVLWWVRYVNRGPLAALGPSRRPLGDLVVGGAAGVGLVALGYLTLALVIAGYRAATGEPAPEPEQVAGCVRGLSLALFAPVVVILAPIGEELYFRGFLYRGLRRRLGVWPAALVSGVLFGFVHFGGTSFLVIIPSLIVVGVGLAVLYERRQSLLAAMAAHASFNLVGYVAIVVSRT